MTTLRTKSVLVLGAVLVVLAVARFWQSPQEEWTSAAPTRALEHEPGNPDASRQLLRIPTGQPVQGDAVEARSVEAIAGPASRTFDPASVESPADPGVWRPTGLLEQEWADRTPRLYLGCLMTDPEYCGQGNQLLVTEPEDPDWSRATEQRLRAIWRENVTGLSDEFLFVMCKKTVCQLNYRFPTEFIYERTPGNTLDSRNRHFGAFHAAFRASNLASELELNRATYAGAIIALEFTRKAPQPSDQ